MIYAHVDEQGQRELEQAMKETTDKKWYRRLLIINLSSQGHPVSDLADMFQINRQTIRTYLHRYNQNGLSRLTPEYGKGREPVLAGIEVDWLALLSQPPSQFEELASGAQNWTQELLVRYLAAYHQVKLTQAALSLILKREGVRWKRAKARVKSPDPLYVVKRQRIETLKEQAHRGQLTSAAATHPPPGEAQPAKLVYLDSTDLHWCPAIGQAYTAVGQQLKVQTPGAEHPWLALFGSLVYPSGEGVYSFHEHKRHQELIYHLQLLMDSFPHSFLFIVLDNASAHTTSQVRAFCQAHPQRLELVFLPTYSPHLNLIERLWRVMRHQVTVNQFFESLDLLAKSVVNWFEKYPLSKFCSLLGVDELQFSFV